LPWFIVTKCVVIFSLEHKLTKDERGKVVDSTKYRKMIRYLIYFWTTRSDLTVSVCLIARYMERHAEIHLATTKRVIRYLKESMSIGILY